MRYLQLVKYLENHIKPGIRGTMLGKLKTWVDINPSIIRCRVNNMIKIMEEVKYDLNKINRDVLNNVIDKHGVELEKAIQYLRSFIRWADFNIDLRYISLANKEYVGLDNLLKTVPFHPNLEKEITELIDSWTSCYTKGRLKPRSIEKIRYYLQLLINFIYYNEPTSSIYSLKCITPIHMRAFVSFMNNESTSSWLTGRRLKKAYINTILSNLKIFINRAYAAEIIDVNPMARIKTQQSGYLTKAGGYLSKTDYNRITYIDINSFKQLNIPNKYRYILPKFSIKLSFLAALRVSELINLAVEDIRVKEIRDGYVPIYIYGAKQRPEGHVDIIWIKYEEIKDDLNLFLSSRDNLLKFLNISDSPIYSDKSQRETHILFLNPCTGNPFYIRENYRHYFSKFMIENGLSNLKNKTHCCRRGLVTYLLNLGWSYEEIMLITRHKTLGMVRRYDSGDFNDNRKRLMKAEIRHEPFREHKEKAQMEENMNFKYFQLIEWLNTKNLLSSKNSYEISDLLTQFDNERLEVQSNALNINNYYTSEDIGALWGLAKTQTYQRLDYFIKANYFHPCNDNTHELLIPKWEVDNFNMKYVELANAASAAGYNSKGKKDYIRKMVASGKIKSIKINRLIILDRTSFEKWLKNVRRRA
ncbi:MAG: site-specific integrase [Elusimicrobia bacterium]|nr:site-specific integrase [Candidatus Liberimonas magnetica]